MEIALLMIATAITEESTKNLCRKTTIRVDSDTNSRLVCLPCTYTSVVARPTIEPTTPRCSLVSVPAEVGL